MGYLEDGIDFQLRNAVRKKETNEMGENIFPVKIRSTTLNDQPSLIYLRRESIAYIRCKNTRFQTGEYTWSIVLNNTLECVLDDVTVSDALLKWFSQ